MAQQTALQQLIEWAVSLKNNSQQCTDWICIKEKAEELLQMEKEQISQAYVQGLIDAVNQQLREYYNETYGTTNSNEVTDQYLGKHQEPGS